jgi:FAD-dependent urate hydroxylase
MKAIVIGAGMGGLCAGIALKRIGYEVKVFEKVREIKPVGAALSIWSNGVKCLNYLGLAEQVAKLGGQMNSMAYIDAYSGAAMTQFSLEPLYQKAGQRAYPVSRTELQAMLLHEFGAADVSLGAELVSVAEEDSVVTATFADGHVETGDLLIAADGSHSVVRPYVLGETTERRYAGYVNWNGLVEVDERIAPATQWTTFVAEGKRVSLMPVGDHRFYFFFDVPLPQGLPNNRDEYKANLKTYFSGWAQPVQDLIDLIDPQSTNRVEICDVEPFSKWTRGRVALLGDAGHGTTPDIGQGGCMAMEDAVYLAIALQTNTLGIEDALVRYQNKRAPRANELVLRARSRCDVTHMKDKQTTLDWYEELRNEDGSKIMAGILSNIYGSPLD